MKLLRVFPFLIGAVMYAQIPNVSTMTPAYGTAMGATFQFTVNNYPNLANFYTLAIVIRPYSSSPLPLQNECVIDYQQYAPGAWGNYLQTDPDTSSAEGGPEGTFYTWGSNSYCDIHAGFSHVVNGNSITFTIPITFKNTLSGPLTIFTNVSDVSGANSGWASWNGWTAGTPGPPVVTWAGPSLPGSGSSASLTIRATDPNSASNIQGLAVYFDNCGIMVYGGFANVAILKDDWSAWQTGVPIGSANILSNSWCQANAATMSVSQSGTTASFTLQVVFQPAWIGSHTVYAQGWNNAGYSTVTAGTWSVAFQTDSTMTLLPTDPGPIVYSDYSGASVRMPTSDVRTIPEAYLTQPTTANQQPFPIGQAYTVVINNASPNSPVWARAVRMNGSASNYAWGPPGGVIVPASGAFLVGNTDATGYFSATWPAMLIPVNPCAVSQQGCFGGSTVTGFWVGGTTAQDPAQPAGVASSVDETTFAGQIWFYLKNPDGTTGSDWSPDAAKRIRLSSGKTISVPGLPAVNVRKPPASSFERDSEGVYTYHFSLDTRDASGSIIRVGNDLDMALKATGENQNGWFAMGFGWIGGNKAERAADVQLSLRSQWQPGPVAIYWHGDPSSIPMKETESSADNVIVARSLSILHDSTQQVTIGPAIKPGISESELRLLVRDWTDTLGFSFLAPLVASSEWAAGLDLLKPSTDLERSIVQCLRAAK